MRMIREYEWAQGKIDSVVGKKHREKEACERRLRQMAKRREKEAKRQAQKADVDAALRDLEATP